MAIFLNFSPTSSHLHPLQVENCGSNSRLVVDEMTMVNSGSKGLRVGVEKWSFCLGFWRPFCSSVIVRNCTHFGLLDLANMSIETKFVRLSGLAAVILSFSEIWRPFWILSIPKNTLSSTFHGIGLSAIWWSHFNNIFHTFKHCRVYHHSDV